VLGFGWPGLSRSDPPRHLGTLASPRWAFEPPVRQLLTFFAKS